MQRQVKYDESYRRVQVRDVASQLFFQHGFHAVSLRQLATEVGLSAGSLYAHFDSKQALLFEIVEHTQEGLNNSIKEDLQKAQRARGPQLEGFVRGVIRYACRERASLLLSIRELHSLSPEQQLRMAQLQAQRAAFLSQALDLHARAIRVREPAITIMTQSVLTTLDGFLYLPDRLLSMERAVKVFGAMANAAVMEILD